MLQSIQQTAKSWRKQIPTIQQLSSKANYLASSAMVTIVNDLNSLTTPSLKHTQLKSNGAAYDAKYSISQLKNDTYQTLKSDSFWKIVMLCLQYGTSGALIGMVALPIVFVVICLIGFMTGGVLALSCAAFCKTGIGSSVVESCFSLFQSLAALSISILKRTTIPMALLGFYCGVFYYGIEVYIW